VRILITGSRDWTDREAVRQALIKAGQGARVHPQETVVVHGQCPTGADKIADELAREFGCQIERHPADWATHGKAAGPIRNAIMVSLGADVCLAFPLGESRGTRSCMRMARNSGIPVVEYGAPS
jgi:SLOG family YspA-like protein